MREKWRLNVASELVDLVAGALREARAEGREEGLERGRQEERWAIHQDCDLVRASLRGSGDPYRGCKAEAVESVVYMISARGPMRKAEEEA